MMMEFLLIVVRWGVFLQTGMACMTWRGTCGNGAGTGGVVAIMAHHLPVIREGPARARSGCSGVAVGAARADYCRTAYRSYYNPSNSYYDFGFRLARSSVPQ